MRKIRIRLAPPTLGNETNITHTATSYMISRSRDFSNTNNILHTNEKDTTNKLEYTVPLDIDSKTTVYTKIKLHFTDVVTGAETESKWSRTTPVSADMSGFKLSDVIIRTPVVEVKRSGDDVTITTKNMSMYSGSGNHNTTSWQVTNSDNKVIYDRPNDKSNTTQLYTQAMDLKKNRAYVFKAKHHTTTNGESLFGKKIKFDYNRGITLFEFIPTSPFRENSRFSFKVRLFVPNFASMDLQVKDIFGTVVKTLDNITTTSSSFETNGLQTNKLYEIWIRIKFTDGKYSLYSKVFTGLLLPYTGSDLYGDGKTDYNNESTPSVDINFGDVINPDGSGLPPLVVDPNDPNYDATDPRHDPLHPENPNNQFKLKRQAVGVTSTYELPDGSIIFTEFVNNAIALYRFDTISFKKSKRLWTFTTDMGIDYLNVLPLPNGDIMMNYCMVDEGADYRNSVWHKFSFDVNKKELHELNKVVIPTHKFSTSVSSSAIVDNEGNIYFIPALEVDASGQHIPLSIYKLDTTTMVHSRVVAVPGNIMYNATFIRDIKGNMYIFGGSTTRTMHETTKEWTWRRDSNKIYKYDPVSTKMTEIFVDYPTTWNDNYYCTQGFLRHDHKIVLFNSVNNGSNLGKQRVLVYDPELQTLEEFAMTTNMVIPFRNNIMLRDGSIIRISSKAIDPQKSYIFVASGRYPATGNQAGQAVDRVSELVIADGTYVEIEDPYMYKRIYVQGTGELIWLSENGRKKFTKDSLIITRTVRVREEVYNALYYDETFILDAADLVIEHGNDADPTNNFYVMWGTMSKAQHLEKIEKAIEAGLIKDKSDMLFITNDKLGQIIALA